MAPPCICYILPYYDVNIIIVKRNKCLYKLRNKALFYMISVNSFPLRKKIIMSKSWASQVHKSRDVTEHLVARGKTLTGAI